MEDSGTSRSGFRRSRLHIVAAALVCLAVLGGSFAGAAALARDDNARRVNDRSEARGQIVAAIAGVSGAADGTQATLQALARSLSVLPNSALAAWPQLSASLLADRGIVTADYIARVPSAARAAWQRAHGPILALDRQLRLVPAPVAAYYDVVALSTTNGVGAPLGFDAHATPALASGLDEAAAGDAPRATLPVRADVGNRWTPLVGLVAPVWGHGRGGTRMLRGYVGVGFALARLLPGLLANAPAGTRVAATVLGAPLTNSAPPRGVRPVTMPFGGEQLRVWVKVPLGPASPAPTILRLGGGLLSVALAALLLLSVRRERYAEQLVTARMAERDAADRERDAADRERNRVESERHRVGARLRAAFSESHFAQAITDHNGFLLEVNPAFAALLGGRAEELVGRSIVEQLHPEDQDVARNTLEEMSSGKMARFQLERRYMGADGQIVWVSEAMALIHDQAGGPPRFLFQSQDVTARRQHERQLRYMADHDPLTGLLNRNAFEREVESHLNRGARYGSEGALLVLDIDHFKLINDTLGHHRGDDLIVAVAGALSGRTRRSDTVARLGGDEFAVLMPHGGIAEAQALADHLLAAIRVGAQVEGHSRPITASIGLAPVTADGPSAEELLINAELAMYDAKEAGRDTVTVYLDSDHHSGQLRARVSWAQRIESALVDGGFELFAQPISCLCCDELEFHELLLRMRDEHGDLIPPAGFLGVAERFDLIREIDRWVTTEAIRLAERHPKKRFSINLSAKSLCDPELLDLITRELARRPDVSADQLVFEITETAAVANMPQASEFGQRLHELGCQLALDDFGAGYGSLAYLKNLPVDIIKIDGQFVANCRTNPTDQVVIEAIVHLARGLGKQTVAEFVQDEETVRLLRDYGVDFAQGYHLGKPVPVKALTRVLRAVPVAPGGDS